MASKQQHPMITKKKPYSSSSSSSSSSISMADFASWYCAIVVIALILLSALRETSLNGSSRYGNNYNGDDHEGVIMVKGNQLLEKGCDEIYVVGEGETLHSISVKCGDPFIVEHNPHIHDPDDVFPGLVIKITTTTTTTIPPPSNPIS